MSSARLSVCWAWTKSPLANAALHLCDDRSLSPLHLAAGHGNAEIANEFIPLGAKIAALLQHDGRVSTQQRCSASPAPWVVRPATKAGACSILPASRIGNAALQVGRGVSRDGRKSHSLVVMGGSATFE